jgi:hypothetical protein
VDRRTKTNSYHAFHALKRYQANSKKVAISIAETQRAGLTRWEEAAQKDNISMHSSGYCRSLSAMAPTPSFSID